MPRLFTLFLVLCGLMTAMMVSPAFAQGGATQGGATQGGAPEGVAPGSAPGKTIKVFMIVHRLGARADEGFRDYLEGSGFDIEFIFHNVNKDKTLLPGLVEEIRRTKPDLIYTQSTMVTRGVVGKLDAPDPENYIRDIPVVFAMVSDPVGSMLALPPDPETGEIYSGRNLTGAIHVVDLEVQFKAMLAYMPVKKLAMVYDATEANQVARVERVKALAEAEGIAFFAASPLNAQGERDAAEIVPMLDKVAAQEPDLLYIPPANFFSGANSMLLTSEALARKLPTFCAIEVQVQDKGMTGLVAPFYNVGQLAGYKAELILRGEKKPQEIPVETLSRFSFVVNMPVARELNLYPPMQILRYARIIGEDDE